MPFTLSLASNLSFIYAQCLTDLALTYRLTACIVRFGYEFPECEQSKLKLILPIIIARLHSSFNWMQNFLYIVELSVYCWSNWVRQQRYWPRCGGISSFQNGIVPCHLMGVWKIIRKSNSDTRIILKFQSNFVDFSENASEMVVFVRKRTHIYGWNVMEFRTNRCKRGHFDSSRVSHLRWCTQIHCGAPWVACSYMHMIPYLRELGSDRNLITDSCGKMKNPMKWL